MDNYFIHNRETGKIELHFEKSVYMALTDEQKAEIKRSFLWGRNTGCWISRAKEPNLYWPQKVAAELGLTDAGAEGEKLTFAEQMERKEVRAERRADRYENHARAAEKRAETLQAPLNSMHGDIAFFTQPNINTSAGRAFTRRRERMYAAYENGFKEFRKSEYWQSRAAAARETAAGLSGKDKGFIQRRIDECEAAIRKIQRNIDDLENECRRIEGGETVKGWHGEILTLESRQQQIEHWLDRMESELDKLGYYQDALDAAGGVTYGKDNLKKGDLIIISRWREPVRFVRGGPKNFTYEYTNPRMTYADGSPMQGKAAYAEIEEVRPA